MARVAVVGIGGIGGYFASAALSAGHETVLCARRPFEQLIIESFDGAVSTFTPHVVTDPAAIGEPVDWVLLATKVHQTAGAAPWLAALCHSDTRIAVLQNGIEHRQTVAPHAPGATVVPTVVYCGGELLEPGRVRWNGRATLFVEEGADGLALAELLAATRVRVHPTASFATEAWRKLITNTVANSITALTLRRMEVFGHRPIVELAQAVVAECVSVARASGADIGDDFADQLVNGWASGPRGGGTSMYYDRSSGRRLEHDAISGAVLRAARAAGVAVPCTETLHVLLDAVDQAAAGDAADGAVDDAHRR